jgi:tripartite-type tricarboxylate transporter receptor subunit TctC
MKVLGVTSAQRSPLYPQWPAIAETLPGYEAVNWAGFCGPAGLPRELTQRLGEDLLAVLKAPDMEQGAGRHGHRPGAAGPRRIRAFIQSEMKRFATVTKPLGTRMN